MANEVTTQGMRSILPISKVFENAPIEDLGEGIRTALAQLTIVQNVFGINHRGTYQSLPNEKLRTVEVVIVKSAKTQSKAFWPGGFVAGSNNAPSCWSSNSLTPDPTVPTPVSKTCGTCPNNVFLTNPNGMKQKLCGDHKRLAIVPADDIVNEAYDGCMIFRVPAGSLGALDKYGSELKRYNVPYYAYTTFITITIDPQKKVTKLVFEPGRPLTDEEAQTIKELRDDEKSGRIVNEVLLGYEEGEEPAPTVPHAAPAAAPVSTITTKPVAPTPVARAIPPAPRTETILSAVAKPATPPPSQRTVVTEPVEEETTSGVDEVDGMFEDIVKRNI